MEEKNYWGKFSLIIGLAGLILIGLMFFGPTTKHDLSLEDQKQLAENWIVNESPTFLFDGFDLEYLRHLEVNDEGCVNCRDFIFNFNSRSAGYGDRLDQTVAQVKTPHQIVIRVSQDEIISAVTDDVFSELDNDVINLAIIENSQEPDDTSLIKAEREAIVVDYLQNNISDLSPVKEVLGGTFYVTNIEFTDSRRGTVEYEDGHIALEAQFEYFFDDVENLEIILFNPIEL
jgi:hypothetical protein